ncbi:proline hydroxylase [Mycobacterium sp. 20091114027_K0903767]|nr:proline hydroxylase [Mycobacterium sp. 20091114027_K0903767]
MSGANPWQRRVDATDWGGISDELDNTGCAVTGPLLNPEEAADIVALYPDEARFRSTIDMGRYRFGEGQYRYFRQPYPPAVTALKRALYPHLLPIARTWWARLGRDAPWPDDFDDWLRMCHAAGQTKTTAILLKYGAGDWNALHRDLYGELIFPLQVVVNLTEPEVDYTGGEFLLYEQRPRAQSRGTATVIPHGHGLVFTTRDRPTKSVRGWSAAPIRHGVSTVRSGTRFTLGLVFHDAA